jgi:hypothetical protein
MANNPILQQWFPHGTGVQLRQRTTIWHNTVFTNFTLLPTLKATVITSDLHQQAYSHTIELAIKPLLHAKLNIVHGRRANPAFGRVTEGIEGLCQLL